ncbi:N-acetylmuramic acid 6-phosphate etherase [Rhodobacter ferrooxidans]|uniref:Sugar isomerase (SIS) n=1 Tax=Rhodobacter ferrooxidans TaxID=371731 RepID=C8RWZ6_9RHOB|nr:N-acetylmuramic acid 6-phosphate etherase [Rhodobacter sp. SW2]EEW26521.1 sugar isomerase (SIS) [Rhodobacter sp. SW2]
MAERPTEARHPSAEGLHAVPAAEVFSRLLNAQADAVDALRPALPALEKAAEAAARALAGGGRMAYAGAGSSGLMALADCLELAGTFGIPPDRTPMLFAGGASALLHMTGAVEDDPALAETDLARAALGPGDVVICLSASGGTPYTLAVARGAKARGAQVIGIANVAGSALLDMADFPLLLDTGPEVVAGSTRMAAATAQKVALNLMSVLVGIRLGHVHDGYMVNVVADNAKLRDRAARIVAAISGQDIAVARDALEQSEGAVKPAILIARGTAPEHARAALDASGGHLAPALAATTN